MTPTLTQDGTARRAAGADTLTRLTNRRALGALALVALGLVAVLPTLFSPFFADDYLHVEVAAHWREALTRGWVLPVDQGGAWWTPAGLSVEYFRPVVVLSFAFDRLLYGDHAAGYHLSNFVVHATTTLLVWGIARRVLGAHFGAWMAAAIFAIHPAHTLAVAWISGRTDMLATMFYAGAFLAHLESREGGRDPLRRAGLVALACASFVVGLLAKEMAITLPAVVLAHDLLDPRGESLAWRLVTPALSGAVAVAYFVARATLLGGFHPPPHPFAYHLGDPGLLLHLVRAPFLYLADLVLFVPPDPMATLPFWSAHPLLLLAFVAIVVATFRTTLQRASSRKIAILGLGWTAVTLLPVLMLPEGEHFLYLPSIGYCLLVGSQKALNTTRLDPGERRSTLVLVALVTAICFGRTGMFWQLSRGASRMIDEAAAALDRAPDATRMLMVDLPASVALAFPPAVRMTRPRRAVDIQLLSVQPHFMADADDLSIMTIPSPDRIELERPSGYLTSYIERALEGPHVPFHAGQTVSRPGYTVTILDAPAGGVRAFSVTLDDPAHTLVLVRGAEGLEPLRRLP